MMFEPLLDNKPWKLIKVAQNIILPLGVCAVLFGFVALLGYLGHFEVLYRPIVNGPATNPLTALSVILIGSGLISGSRKIHRIRLLRFIALIVVIITSFRIIDGIFSLNISALFTPFQDQVELELQLGKSNSMGINSAIMLFCTAGGMALYGFHKPIASQFVASIAMAIPTISFTGYFYGLEQFYGQMSFLTAFTGFMVALATFSITANFGALKAFLSPYIGGRIVRLQSIASIAVPTILGYLVIKLLARDEGNSLALYVVAISWFILLMIGISAVFLETSDKKRRESEHLLEDMAMSDQLTGLPNRRKFFDFGQYELERIKRSKNQLWVLMLDIDHFKSINDTAGHAMGDEVLIEVGNVLKKSIRTIDLACRIGGDEFSILLVDSNQQGAQRVADCIREGIKKIRVDGQKGMQRNITTSIGGASSDGSLNLDQMLKLADEALYKSKENGRDQFTFAD